MREIVAKLEHLLRLRSIPFGMKLCQTVAEMEAIPRIRRPKGSQHTLDQIVAQAARLGWTVGITADDLVGDQCRSVVGPELRSYRTRTRPARPASERAGPSRRGTRAGAARPSPRRLP